jgi:hypothetical protein
MARCQLCGITSADISKAFSVCLVCIRRRPQKALEMAVDAHRTSRAQFGLPPVPPDDPDGILCNLCVNTCKIGKDCIGYCGLRKNQDGRLTGASTTKAKLSWYHDPLPTNCVANWVCGAGTGAGYPTCAHCLGAESGYNNLAVFKNLHVALTSVENQRTIDNFTRAAAHISQRSQPPVLIANTLLVTGYIDAEEVAAIARFIASLDPNIPYSLQAFHPQFYMSDLPLTSRALADRCCQAARDAGLNNVRIGNVHLLT